MMMERELSSSDLEQDIAEGWSGDASLGRLLCQIAMQLGNLFWSRLGSSSRTRRGFATRFMTASPPIPCRQS
jgi:hypothetical protein